MFSPVNRLGLGRSDKLAAEIGVLERGGWDWRSHGYERQSWGIAGLTGSWSTNGQAVDLADIKLNWRGCWGRGDWEGQGWLWWRPCVLIKSCRCSQVTPFPSPLYSPFRFLPLSQSRRLYKLNFVCQVGLAIELGWVTDQPIGSLAN